MKATTCRVKMNLLHFFLQSKLTNCNVSQIFTKEEKSNYSLRQQSVHKQVCDKLCTLHK